MGNRNEPPKPGKGLKIMTPKQMITRLPILLVQEQAGNNSQKLKNEIRQTIYSLYSSRNLSKTIYNHLTKTIKMSNIFMSTENSKTSDPNRFRLYFTDKIDLRENKTIALFTTLGII